MGPGHGRPTLGEVPPPPVPAYIRAELDSLPEPEIKHRAEQGFFEFLEQEWGLSPDAASGIAGGLVGVGVQAASQWAAVELAAAQVAIDSWLASQGVALTAAQAGGIAAALAAGWALSEWGRAVWGRWFSARLDTYAFRFLGPLMEDAMRVAGSERVGYQLHLSLLPFYETFKPAWKKASQAGIDDCDLYFKSQCGDHGVARGTRDVLTPLRAMMEPVMHRILVRGANPELSGLRWGRPRYEFEPDIPVDMPGPGVIDIPGPFGDVSQAAQERLIELTADVLGHRGYLFTHVLHSLFGGAPLPITPYMAVVSPAQGGSPDRQLARIWFYTPGDSAQYGQAQPWRNGTAWQAQVKVWRTRDPTWVAGTALLWLNEGSAPIRLNVGVRVPRARAAELPASPDPAPPDEDPTPGDFPVEDEGGGGALLALAAAALLASRL